MASIETKNTNVSDFLFFVLFKLEVLSKSLIVMLVFFFIDRTLSLNNYFIRKFVKRLLLY